MLDRMKKITGAARRRQSTRPPARADDLADVVLQDHRGDELRLGDLWRDQPAVLVFLRHYGWIFCRAHAVQLHRDQDQFDAAGVRLAVIGQGTPRHAAQFIEEYDLDGMTVLVDPDRRTYKAAGTKVATVDELFRPQVVARGVKIAATERLVQGATKGHPAQLGGVLVVAIDGNVTWSHLAEDASDNPPNEKVLQAARDAADTS